jgi:hypothetical protein
MMALIIGSLALSTIARASPAPTMIEGQGTPQGWTFTSGHYDIDGPNHLFGDFSSPTGPMNQLAVLVPIPDGIGYHVTLTGTASNGAICSGTAGPFDVVPSQTLTVIVGMTCTQPASVPAMNGPAALALLISLLVLATLRLRASPNLRRP